MPVATQAVFRASDEEILVLLYGLWDFIRSIMESSVKQNVLLWSLSVYWWQVSEWLVPMLQILVYE